MIKDNYHAVYLIGGTLLYQCDLACVGYYFCVLYGLEGLVV